MSKKKKCLEQMLQRCLDCSRPFRELKRPIAGGKNYFTKVGEQAYDKLMDIVYSLEEMGAIPDADDVIEKLDSIVEDREKGDT